MNMNLWCILEDGASAWPEREAIVCHNRVLRYADLLRAAERVAAKFRDAGVQAGHKIGFLCVNTPEYVVAGLAVLRLEAVAVPLSPALKAPEIARLSEKLKLDAIISSPQLGSLMSQWNNAAALKIPVLADDESLCVQVGTNQRTSQSERAGLTNIHAALIRFTSGTTSNAKEIVLSHSTLLERIYAQNRAVPVIEDDRILWLQPLALAFGGPLFVHLLRGSCLVIGNPLVTGRLPELIRKHRVTQFQAPPLFYRMMINEESIAARDLVGVKWFVCTGSTLPNEVLEGFPRRFGREILQYYGLVECGRVLANLSEESAKRGSVGTPQSNYQIKLDATGFDKAGADDVGELLVRGPGLFDAYCNPWQRSEEILDDGWFRTGDIARRNAEGYYWIIGRIKEMINVAGMKVFPQELEEILLTHPDVEGAIVYGAREARFGEVPRAKVKLRDGAPCKAKDVIRHVNDRVAFFKALRGIEFVDEIPKTVTGKTRRWT